MKVLVTGGSGFLGTHVKRYFGADDLSRRSGLDILNLQDVGIANGYDVVIHLAAFLDKSPKSAERVFLTNVEGTINLLREMRSGSVFIFASTKDVYGRFADNFREVPESCPTLYSGQSALEWSKLIAERYVEFYAHTKGFRACVIRLSTVYAPRSDGNTPSFVTAFADQINMGEPLTLPADGRARRDLLHVDDLSRACQSFVDSAINYGLYNVGGGPQNTLSLGEIVTKLEEVSGLQAVRGSEAPDQTPVPMNYVTDLSLVRQELGWQPEMTLDEGFKTLF